MSPPLPDWLRVIRTCGPHPPAWMVHHVRGLGAAAREPLLAMLDEVAAPVDPEETEDFVADHAVALLRELGYDARVAGTCLERLLTASGPHAHTLIETLVRFGPEVAPLALEAYDRLLDDDTDTARDLVSVLARCGARDDAVHAALADALERWPHVAAEVGHLGDVRLIEALARIVDAWEPTDLDELYEDRSFTDPVLGAADSLAMLGAELTERQREIVEREPASIDRWADDLAGEAFPTLAEPRPAPNAPCWCGSDRKYKKCHMASDEEAARG
jgi:SEC-C motif-containing protein